MLIDSAMAAELQKATVSPRWLIWFKVKNATTGAPVSIGLHTGIDELPVTVEGESRTYIGAGGIIDMPALVYEKGYNIKTQSLTLSNLSTEVVDLIRNYDVKFGEVHIHLAVMDTVTEQILSYSSAFKGSIDEVSISETPETSTVNFTLVSNAREGTRVLYTKKSHASQKLRDANDQGRKYADTAGSVKITWGQKTDQKPIQKKK